jgi:hypothetical protein
MPTLTLDNLKRGHIVRLNIPAARPIKTLGGVLHECGSDYAVLGFHGTLVRLSRRGDCEKLMVTPDMLIPAEKKI